MSHRRSFARRLCLDSSSDEEELYMAAVVAEEEEERFDAPCHGGSVPGRQFIDRESAEGYLRLYKDYFAENSTYPERMFRRRFRMHRPLFLRIASAIQQHDRYFVQKRNNAGTLGLHPLQKITAAFRMLAYGLPADATDDYCRLAKATALESLRRFVRAVIEVFGDEYLRSPDAEDTARLLAIGEQRGFPGMLGSIDCMHWEWKNCPTAYQCFFVGHVREPTIILEAVASQDLWIWHSFFGLPGSHNDINVLHRSPVFARLAEGQAPEVNYDINGHSYKMGYYLADGIYPQWATFVKTISNPIGQKNKNFSQFQEGARKDVERAFGVLQSRFAIVRGPAMHWNQETLGDIMTACIIMHNMIIENERENPEDYNYDFMGERVKISRQHAVPVSQFL